MSADGGPGRDSDAPKRRMLPAVTDVVRELARTVSADPAVLFKAARSSVADELARVKQGFESAPLDVLVKRARRQLEKEGVATPVSEPDEPTEKGSISIPAPPFKPKTEVPAKKKSPSSEEPFQSAGAADLGWESDLHIQADDAPFRSAILPLPKSRAPQDFPPPGKVVAPVPAAPAAPAPKLPVPDRVLAPEGLAVERSGAAPRPSKPVEDLPLFSAPTLQLPTPVAPEQPKPPAPAAPPAFAEVPAFAAPDTPTERVERPAPRSEPTPPVEPPAPRFDPPPRAEPPAPRAEARTPWVEPPSPRFEPPARVEPSSRFQPHAPRVEPEPSPFAPPAVRIEPPVKSMSEMPPLASLVVNPPEPPGPDMRAYDFKAAEAAPPRKKASKTGWIVAIVLVLAVAAGLAWAVRTFLSGSVVRNVAAPPPPPKKVAAAPATAAPPTAPAATAAAASAPARATPAPKTVHAAPPPAAPARAAAPVPKGKAAPLVTSDWSGRPVYVVHFSSYKDRPSADKEAKRLAGELGKPGRAVEVDLGAKGTWYRVVIGEFATPEEARGYRADLEAKKTPGLGFVYEMRGR